MAAPTAAPLAVLDNSQITDFERDYRRRIPHFERLREEASYAIEQMLAEDGIKVHEITSRVKEWRSLRDKIVNRGATDPFTSITDIVGLRIVCLFLSDVTAIGGALRKAFHVVSEDNKIGSQQANSFGYMSVHFVVELPPSYSGPRYDELRGIQFEVQVRTVAMHAWAVASHYLDYKTEIDIPEELRRDFYALSALFYVADTHFELFHKHRIEARRRIAEEIEVAGPGLEQPLNLDTMTEYLRRKFPQRRQSAPESVSRLVTELATLGFKTVAEIERVVFRAERALAAYERAAASSFSRASAVRMSLVLTDETYRKRYFPEHETLARDFSYLLK